MSAPQRPLARNAHRRAPGLACRRTSVIATLGKGGRELPVRIVRPGFPPFPLATQGFSSRIGIRILHKCESEYSSSRVGCRCGRERQSTPEVPARCRRSVREFTTEKSPNPPKSAIEKPPIHNCRRFFRQRSRPDWTIWKWAEPTRKGKDWTENLILAVT